MMKLLPDCIYPLINEAALILEEGIASRPGDIDIIWINGYGFPAPIVADRCSMPIR